MPRTALLLSAVLGALCLPRSALALGEMCVEQGRLTTVELRPVELTASHQVPREDQSIPWCASPDDPRCAPDGDSEQSSGRLRILLASFTRATAPPAGSANTSDHEGDRQDGRRSGFASRVERPPR